jgi:hypothetical protein
MSKAKGSAATDAANHAAAVMMRTVCGGLCGIGAVWSLTAFWPVSRNPIRMIGTQIEHLSGQYPVVMVGLMAGCGLALLWQAVRR